MAFGFSTTGVMAAFGAGMIAFGDDAALDVTAAFLVFGDGAAFLTLAFFVTVFLAAGFTAFFAGADFLTATFFAAFAVVVFTAFLTVFFVVFFFAAFFFVVAILTSCKNFQVLSDRLFTWVIDRNHKEDPQAKDPASKNFV
jgi:hypothetical protein